VAAVFWEHQAKTLKMVFSSAPQENFLGSNFFRGEQFFLGEHQEAESRKILSSRWTFGQQAGRQGDRYGLRD